MENVLVLGCNGFIGRHLTKSLLSDGAKVVGYDIQSNCTEDMVNYIQGDFITEHNFEAIMKEHDIKCIYHLISTTIPFEGTESTIVELQNNVIPTLRLLEAATKCNVERFIFPSSGGTVYGEGNAEKLHKEEELLHPLCSYGIQKEIIESYLQLYHHLYGLQTCIVRISNAYGFCIQTGRTQGIIPIFIQRLLQGKGITLYGNTVRDYIYIDDVIAALIKLRHYNGNEIIFNIGSGQGTCLQRVVELIENNMRMHFTTISHEPIRSCDVKCSVLDCTLARQELNWIPQVGIEDGIERTIQMIRKDLLIE